MWRSHSRVVPEGKRRALRRAVLRNSGSFDDLAWPKRRQCVQPSAQPIRWRLAVQNQICQGLKVHGFVLTRSILARACNQSAACDLEKLCSEIRDAVTRELGAEPLSNQQRSCSLHIGVTVRSCERFGAFERTCIVD